MRPSKSSSRVVPADHDLSDLQKRAARHTISDTPAEFSLASTRKHLRQAFAFSSYPIQRFPRRYTLHLFLLLFVPLALLGKGSQLSPSGDLSAAPYGSAGDTPLWQYEARPFTVLPAHHGETGLVSGEDSRTTAPAGGRSLTFSPDMPGPLMLTTRHDVRLPGGLPADPAPDDTPLSESSEAETSQAPESFSAQVVVEKANLRNGPGTNYDKIGFLLQEAQITVLARHQDWVHIRTAEGQLAWLSAELIDLPVELVQSLPEAQEIPAPPPPLVATVAEDNLNLRDGPGTEYIGMTKLQSGARVDLLARYGDWFQVITEDGSAGWVLGEYLSMVEGVWARVPETDSIPPANPALVGWVIENSVNLRSGPSTKYDSLGKLQAGTELELLARYKDWYKVVTPRGTKGWISADLLEVSAFVKRRVPLTDNIPPLPKSKPAQQPASGSAPVNVAASGDVAGIAWQFVGYPYVWGGESPRVGFDCSGLTKYVYSLVGVYLPHNARAQFNTHYGAIINDIGSLQAGDLVFFVNTAGPGISHVGLYVGGGQIIHATSPRTGVIVSNIWDRYWVNHFYAGLRVYR